MGVDLGSFLLRTMRQFYLLYPAPGKIQSSAGKSEIRQSVIDEFTRRSSKRLSRAIEQLDWIARAFPLPWTHYVRLLRVRNALAREFYAREALACGWSVRQPIFVKLNR